MNKLFLEVPTIKRKDEALDYLDEHVKYNSDLNGSGSLDRCLDKISYEEWLIELQNKEDLDYALENDRCPSRTFFVIRESDNRIIGMINIRWNVTEDKIRHGWSHIGYGIRPSERRKGYAKIALYYALLEEAKLGVKRVLLDCVYDNIGSNKTILALGGALEKSEIDPYDDTLTNYYWIDVDDSIEKYKNIYKEYIDDLSL